VSIAVALKYNSLLLTDTFMSALSIFMLFVPSTQSALQDQDIKFPAFGSLELID